jgi:hypothetical protein
MIKYVIAHRYGDDGGKTSTTPPRRAYSVSPSGYPNSD